MVLDFPSRSRLLEDPSHAHDGPCWVIWSMVRKAYWRSCSAGGGFTEDLGEAGRYTRAEADGITANGGLKSAGFNNDGPSEVARLAPEFIPDVSILGQVLPLR